ncbi:ABC transporter permease [Simiduia sp. 21SJ11W-1]|uniref:ABC transporter permease n=1 Tax=Simiduia sp. 21SJ11W-1 TaxID=2909669 RepID=UPI0020A0F919|nr:ABC transporter permease [Simiduia sp. 21SJ11W-1]UTA47604.1 ABC transporter permease [Simiduia sp. 21SJ11W-1]
MTATVTTAHPLARIFRAINQAPAGEPFRQAAFTLVTLLMFLVGWHIVASKIDTSLGQLPGPTQVYTQMQSLWAEHQQERGKEQAFYERQQSRNEKKLAQDPNAKVKWRDYRGRPTFVDQIGTSLVTAFVGFILASLVAVPLGIICGLSSRFYNSVNPLIQIFKPISPLAWLPLVTMVISAVYVSDDPLVAKSFLVSAVTVTLCCLWPTLINTTVAVSSVDQDLVNVSKVLRLSPLAHIRKIVIPSAIPGIFTGLRLSLSVGWMVLIAAEMLAQNPGLGKFVWDEFQNGSSQSLARIMVAVFAIGVIGFALDRTMLLLQKTVSWDKSATLR